MLQLQTGSLGLQPLIILEYKLLTYYINNELWYETKLTANVKT